MVERLQDRYRRLLLLIPYVLQNQGIHLDELSAHFGVTRERLIEDLNLIFVCGLPGYGPGDLIEVDIDGDRVSIRAADYLSQPQTITPAEGLMLYAAATASRTLGGDSTDAPGAIAALEKALGVDRMGSVSFDVEEPDHMTTLRKAVDDKKQVHIIYRSMSKDEETSRDVDPWGFVLSSGRWYLVGWCHKVEDERVFLIDRIRTLKVLRKAAKVPEDFRAADYGDIYSAGDDSFRLIIEVSPRAAWVRDYYKIAVEHPLEDGWFRLELDATGQARFIKLLLRLGENARLVSPASMKEELRSVACRMLEKYS